MKYWFEILKNSGSLGVLTILTFLISIMGLLSPIFIIHIFNRYISFGLQGTLLFLVTGAICVAVFEFVFRNLRNKIFNEIIFEPSRNLKLDLVKQFFSLDVKSSKKNFIDIIDFNNSFFQFISPKNQSSLFDSFFAFFIIFILFFLDFFLATIFVIILFLFILVQNRMINEKRKLFVNEKFSNDERNIVKEIASNLDLIKSTNAINYTGFNIDRYFNKKLKIDSLVSNIDVKQASFINFFIILSSIIIIGVGSIIVVEGTLSIGSLIGFNIFATRALGIIASTQNAFYVIKKTDEYIEDCRDYFIDSKNRSDGMQLSRCDGAIKLKNIDFSYSNETNFLFKNFSYSFNPGEINVIFGSNASGKSTLVKLLIGLLKPNSGEILIDNTNLEKLSLVWYRENISYVSQNVEVLNSSIMDNILLSNPKLNEQEVSRLLQNVGLDDDLKNSNLSISGFIDKNLSNGILKKVQIARAIAKNSKFYIFDDPFLFLDLEGKKVIMKLLTSLKRSGKTVICFSNDNEIISFADKKINIGKNYE